MRNKQYCYRFYCRGKFTRMELSIIRVAFGIRRLRSFDILLYKGAKQTRRGKDERFLHRQSVYRSDFVADYL